MEALPEMEKEQSFENMEFFVKTTEFQRNKVSYCLQAFDGPCPLLAIANVLLLRAKLHIRAGADRLKTSHILTLIGDNIASNVESSQDGVANVDEVLSHLRDLQYGLQVNCGFGGCQHFERTGPFRVFEMLDIKVVHGWIPERPEEVSVLDSLHYNATQEMLAVAMELEESHDNNLSEDQLELMAKAALIRQFLDSSPSQLTYEGLTQICSSLEEDELAVLFRQNHFATVIRRNGALYTLVTDIGYKDNTVIWETLEGITGDTQMVDHRFLPVQHRPAPAALSSVPVEYYADPTVDADAAMAARIQAESDAAFARSLQAEEESKNPVGKLTPMGHDAQGREVLQDELGRRFIRAKKPEDSKKPRSPRRHKNRDAYDDSSDESEENKCVVM